jgi:hypothetical protein
LFSSILQEAERAAARIAARLVHPVIAAYLEIYLAGDDDDDDEPEERILHDPRSTVYGQFEAARNIDHTTEEIFAFGFGRNQRRVSDAGEG